MNTTDVLPADKDILDKSQRLDRALSRSPGSSMHGAKNFMDQLNRSRRAGQANARQQQDQSTSFDLTGRTGSYMYMAPEVLMGQPYNEKVGSPQGLCRSRGSHMSLAPKVQECCSVACTSAVGRGVLKWQLQCKWFNMGRSARTYSSDLPQQATGVGGSPASASASQALRSQQPMLVVAPL